MNDVFDRSKHVYKSNAFEEIIKDTIRFFNGTPVHELPPPENFIGTGVYALYYIGKNPYYKILYDLNRLEFKQPIYVRKVGGRQGQLGNLKVRMNFTEGYVSTKIVSTRCIIWI